ncbi:restriction endonuclease subunit S (plasmid) [Shewanella xiamenensis]|uniref:restriction endonuclease subunit S n=1 Tax=Shewanella xiamenensis TaxID=332186 RepID=UPI001C4E070E|nr:restriction endonuclease subunit S [Shewanella xiamenensis]MCT8858073.1 restriction endonuclease subunit S [Shewanella xiamenensis]UWG66949.1 restriction endonuclease subunit S [Shewanella xiamenensis]
MRVEKNVPEIRFEGFSGEWAQRPFGDCFDNIPNNTLSRADLNYEHGIAKNVHYGDVLIKFGEILDASDTSIPFVTDENVVSKQKHAALKNGDIVIADAAEDSTVGKCTELFNIDEQVILSGLHTIAVRPNLPFASKYLGYYLNSSSYHDQLLPLMQGTKVLSISKTALKNTSVNFPSANGEQIQIGNYFQKFDSLINQHQQKHDKLSNIKKAMLEKMFPKQGENIPEIRFKGFSGEWEEKGITDISKVFIGLVTTMTTSYRSKGVLLIRNSDIKSNRFEFSVNPIYLDEKFADENSSRRLMLGDVVTVHTGDVGTSAVVTEKEEGSIGFATIVSRPNKNIVDSNYLSVFLNTDIHKSFAINVSTGDGRANYNLKDFYKLNVPLPAVDEQAKIGNYFQKLDELINQHQQQITKLNNIKQACLSKMFV